MHVYEKRLADGKRVVQKDAYRLGLLSPNRGNTHRDSLNVDEPNALMLTSESVLYPYLDKVSEPHMNAFCV